jgi:hypothetical protein
MDVDPDQGIWKDAAMCQRSLKTWRDVWSEEMRLHRQNLSKPLDVTTGDRQGAERDTGLPGPWLVRGCPASWSDWLHRDDEAAQKEGIRQRRWRFLEPHAIRIEL